MLKVHFISEYTINSIADVFVLPTLDEGRKEGCPVALLEAMACNIPIIASEIPGVKDILYSFPDHMFRPGDAIQLKNKISNSFNIDSIKTVRKDLRKFIIKNYSIDREVFQHEKIYQKLFIS